jgi:hypothetical protein
MPGSYSRAMPGRAVRPTPPTPSPAASPLRRWAPFAGAVAVSALVLFAPNPDVPGEGVPGLDKVVHAVVFAALAFTGLRAGLPARWFVPAVLGYALASEAVQGWALAGRSGDPWDLLADAGGVALGTWLHRRAAGVTFHPRRRPDGSTLGR